MHLHEAVELIREAVSPGHGTWADIGAGTGIFSEALMELLESGKIIAVDKSPHSLYSLKSSKQEVVFEILEGDFHQLLDLPPLDGILMANSLH